MLRRIAFCGFLVSIAFLAHAQPVPTTNPSFTEGKDAPAGWKLVGKGEWNLEDGNRFISAIGDGSDSSYWLSEVLPLKPATVYHLSFRARMSGSGGTPVSGPMFCNRDLGRIGSEWKESESVFVTPAVLRPEDCRLRFGQWEVRGRVEFDDIHLYTAQAVYAHQGEIVLGEGEMILGNEYTFAAPFQRESRNHSRLLDAFNCGFNTDRWVIGNGSYVIYKHRIEKRKQASAEVSVSVTYHTSGALAVEASADGKKWAVLGMIDKVNTKLFKIPETMLPADEIYVRLTADATRGNVGLQVGGYGYGAKIDGEPSTLIGRTDFFQIIRADPRFVVTIEDIGDRVPGSKNNIVRLRINNRSGQQISRNIPVVFITVTAPVGPLEDEGVLGDSPDGHDIPTGACVRHFSYSILRAGMNALELRGFDVLPFEARLDFRVPELNRSDYGETLSSGKTGPSVWWASSGQKVSATRGVPEAKAAAMAISAAKNETETAQLVIRPEKPLRGFTARAGELTGPSGATIPASAIDILRVRYLLITRPTDATGAVGLWPDPLPQLKEPINLDANQNQPLWIRVHVPKDAKPGDYTCKIKLTADGYSDEVALKLHVYDFALPDRMTCQSAFGFSPQEVFRYQKLTRPEDRRVVMEKYLADFAAHHISPYDPTPLDPIKVTWQDAKTNPRPVFDFAAWDKAMARALDEYHFNSFIVHIPGMGGGSFHERVEPELLGFKENTPQYKSAFESYCRQLQEHLNRKGWTKYAFIYWFDEPDKKDYDFVNNGFRKLKSAAPAIPRMLTEQVEPELVGGPNIWCPITDEYNHERAELRRKEGEKFWWYVCTGPKAPYCTLFIDHPATELRVWLWQTWQRKIDGILVWQSNYWTSGTAYPDRNRPQHPYEDPMSWTSGYGVPSGTKAPWGNGDGRFIYPPEAAASGNPDKPILDGPVDSIRWEMLRDGIEDYEYMVILRGLIEQKKEKLAGAQRERFARLLDVPAEITKDMTTFTKDPRPIEQRRDEIARAIEELRKM